MEPAAGVPGAFQQIIAALPGATPAIRSLLAQRLRLAAGVAMAPIGGGFAMPHPSARVSLGRDSGTIALLLLSESVLADSLTAIGFPICFYYGFTGVACGWYFRHELGKSARNFLLLGLGPLLGGLMLFGIGIKAAFYYGHTANVESKPILGITLPLWMGIGGMLLGVVIMIASRPYFREFFSRKTETAPSDLLEQPPPTEPVPARVDF